MSTTTTTAALTSTTLVGMLPTITNATGLVPGKNCPTCGQDSCLSQEHAADQERIKELEEKVGTLNVQAAQMAEKLAQYEHEIRRLRTQTSTYAPRNGSSVSSTSSNEMSQPLSPLQPPSSSHSQGRLSTLTSFLHSRGPSGACPTQTPAQPVSRTPSRQSSPDNTAELQNALDREQTLRRAAESQLSQTTSELEELTAQLFSQANEMVAQERKARARLEERVAVLERRDVEKRTRLERLEKAMERVERIRALVG
ncbi:hypothetical protein ETB97_011345 [Aspergillus alliaceus]|uniref:GDP/GTP exchange factor Sec2 N-terminal domain-containing protein n=1 Tax=Petromyces alliaceus TaxID=209559 RepID=A0A5N6GC03_PETAA|nr:uncharacterized protein BDW43DRAFT_261078 [Aspergillus alliaceus]KAB8239255.1 hypothetical protein BDW43DRAFT_261078 [Aspergillus alliaceus]KAE8395686.1 hypothetical protein BDV23DRAFT_144569 [Aspergillus alliaceus]KAF5862614.1 hypothetical protein ETB97_011345 [Aspergillus burnettii]